MIYSPIWIIFFPATFILSDFIHIYFHIYIYIYNVFIDETKMKKFAGTFVADKANVVGQASTVADDWMFDGIVWWFFILHPLSLNVFRGDNMVGVETKSSSMLF